MPLKDKAARKASAALRYQTHKDEWGPKYAAHREANREKNRTYAAAYYRAHRDDDGQKEVAKKRAAEYYRTHKEENRAKAATRRARLRALEAEKVLISELYTRDKGICGICHRRVEWEPKNPRMIPSHDHIIPVAQGGPNTYANARLAHLWCNQSRGTRGHGQPRLM